MAIQRYQRKVLAMDTVQPNAVVQESPAAQPIERYQRTIQEQPTNTPSVVSIPQPVPTQGQMPAIPTEPQKPDVVSPFVEPDKTQITQGVGENPNSWQYGYGPQGHEGMDLINENTQVTNPIGGLNVSGYSPKGYGNWEAVVGASPEELAQMSPDTKEALRQKVVEYMTSNPADIRGLDVGGKNVSLQAHLANPAPSDSEIATGSANLQMGGSGGMPIHLHSAFKNTQGNMLNVLDLIRNKLK
jgi:hypothetical protein